MFSQAGGKYELDRFMAALAVQPHSRMSQNEKTQCFSIILIAYNPTQKADGPSMARPPALEFPARELLIWNILVEESLHLFWRSCSEARDIAVIDPNERNNRNEVGEEQMSRRVPEVIGCDEHGKWPQEADEDEGGEMA